MTVEARAQGGVMDWQERLWGRVQRAGDWPDRTLEIVCSVTALSFFLSALIYDYFPFFALGASFTAVGWLVEEKRRTDEARLLAPVWGLLRRCLTRPVRTVTAAALLVVGVWREAVWIALVGLVVLRWAVRQAREAAAPQTDERESDAEL